jgi:hypothetical protein
MRPEKERKTLSYKKQTNRKNPRKPGLFKNDSQSAAQKSRTNSRAISKSYTLNRKLSDIKDLAETP